MFGGVSYNVSFNVAQCLGYGHVFSLDCATKKRKGERLDGTLRTFLTT